MKLPVGPGRLRTQFPALGDEDLEAYARVTRRVLSDPARKGRILREVMQRAQAARLKLAAGQALTRDEDLALRYRRAVDKMQAPVRR